MPPTRVPQVCKDFKGSLINCGEFSLNRRCDGNTSVGRLQGVA